MKRTIIFFFIVNLVYTFSIAQEKFLSEDGNFWLNISEPNKVGIMFGFYMAISTVAKNNLLAHSTTAYALTELQKEVPKDARVAWLIMVLEGMIKSLDFANITVGQLVDGVDNFYKNFANRNIKLIDAIYITRMEIRGFNPELVSAQVRYLRMMPDVIINSDKYLEKVSPYISVGPEGIKKAILSGIITKDDFLKAGFYVDDNGTFHPLMYYGDYK